MRALQLGLRLEELTLLDYADVLDMLAESQKDFEEPEQNAVDYQEATQADFDAF